MVAITAADRIVIRVTGQGVQGPPGLPGATVAHAPTHSRVGLGGVDSITVENLATGGASGSVPTSDGAGGMSMTVPSGSGNVASPGGETAGNLAEFTGTNTIDETSITTASVSGHLASIANPHSVTAVQAGAEPAGSIATHTANADAHHAALHTLASHSDTATTGAALDAHLASSANPHAVTAAQAGADPAGTATAAVSAHDALTSAHSTLPVENLAATSTDSALVFGPDGAGGVQARAETGGGSGDFLADGTVPMTGDLDTGGNDVVNFVTAVGSGSSSSLGSFLTEALSAGRITGGLITEATSTTVDVALGKGAIRSIDDATDELRSIGWSASLGTTIPIDTILFFGVEWNSGSPQIINKGTDTWNYQNEFPLGSATRDSTGIHITSSPQMVGDAPGETNRRFYETLVIARDNRQGGLALGETGVRNMTLSAGALWSRLNRFSISSIDTGVSGSVDFYFRDGAGGFNVTPSLTQWPNTEFDDGTGTLATMTNGRYAVLWFYVGFDGDLVAQYGRAEYNQIADAEGEAPPSTAPLRISDHSTLVGRFIFQEGAATTESISSVFDILFSSSGVTAHSELSGLTPGDAGHTDLQLRNEKNNPSGYAGLDGGTKLTGTHQLYGAASDTACEGDDSRLSDSRIPTGTAGGDLNGTYPNPLVDDGADSTAIHDNVQSEISAIAEKVTPAGGDFLIIEDITDSNNKKRVQVGNLPTGGGGEANDLVNAGTGITMVATPSKSGLNLQARSVSAGSSKLSITEDGPNENNAFDVVEANIVHQNISGGAATNTHAQIDTHIADTANPHATDIGNLGSGTLAELNTAVTDATLDTNTASRPPSGTAAGSLTGTYPNPGVADGADSTAIHDNESGEILAVALKAAPAAADVVLIEDTAAANIKKRTTVAAIAASGLPAAHALGGAQHTSSTLAQLNALVSDATLDDSAASRPPTGTASGDLGGTYPAPIVDAITTTTGPTSLAIGAIADGSIPQRTGSTLVGGLAAADVFLRTGAVSATGDFDLGTNAITNVGNVDGRDVSADGIVLDAHVANTSTTSPHTNTMMALRTGARNGGFVTIVTGTTFSVSDGDGFVVDNATTPGTPVVTSVSWSGITGITATQIGTSEFTIISIDSTGSLVQGTSLSPVDRRDKIILGILGHNAATLTNVEQLSNVIYEQDFAFSDFMNVLGLVNADGNDYTRATIAALGLDVTSGNMFFPGINLNDTAANRRNPNLKSQTGATDISWTYIRGDGSGGITVDGTGVTDINVTQRDDGAGGLVALTGNGYKVDLIFRHSDGGTVVQFGSIQFASLSDAVNAAITTANPLLSNDFIFRFALVVKRNTTDLNTAADAQFIEVTGVGGTGSSSIGGGDVLGPAGGVVAGEATEFSDSTGKVIRGTSGLLTANISVLDGTRLFSSAIVQAAIPEWSVRETGVAADSGNWAVRADGTTFRISAVDDALTGVTDAFTITRSGATPSIVEALTNFVASSTAKISQSVDDTTTILTLSNSGTNTADVEVYAGDRNPEGNVTASPGALYIRANGINSAMYQLDAAASANTPWVELGAGAGASGVAEIQVGLDSLTAAVPIGGTPTSVAMDFSAVTFDTAVYTFSVSDTDVTINTTGRYQIILDGSIQSTAVGDSQILAEIFKTGVPVTNAQMQVTVDNSTVTRNGFTVTRIIDLSAGDAVGPRFTQTSGSGSASVSPGSLRFSLVFYSGSIAGAVGRKATWGLVTTAPHAIDTDSGTPFKADGSGDVRELEAVAQLDTDVAGGTFTFDVKHGPDAGPFVSIGTVSITQGNRSGSFVPGSPVAFAAGDVFVIDRTAIGAFPGGTAEDKQRITVQLHVDLD